MPGRGLILVRHAMPEVERGIASKLWSWAKSAKEDCVLLANALPDDLAPTIYASDEPKAQQTAAVIALRRGLATAIDPGFGEVDRSAAGWIEDHRAAALRYLETGEAPGWEPREQVVRRFSDAVARAMEQPGEGAVVVGTRPGDEPVPGFPDEDSHWRVLGRFDVAGRMAVGDGDRGVGAGVRRGKNRVAASNAVAAAHWGRLPRIHV